MERTFCKTKSDSHHKKMSAIVPDRRLRDLDGDKGRHFFLYLQEED